MKRALGAQGPGTAHHGGRELTVPRCCGRSRATRLAFPEAFLRQTLQGLQRHQKCDKKVSQRLEKEACNSFLAFRNPILCAHEGGNGKNPEAGKDFLQKPWAHEVLVFWIAARISKDPDSQKTSFEFNGIANLSIERNGIEGER